MSREQNLWDVHVRSSQYLKQIVKCVDERDCLKPINSYFSAITEKHLSLLYLLLKEVKDEHEFPSFLFGRV
jgi:hypothetical protein